MKSVEGGRTILGDVLIKKSILILFNELQFLISRMGIQVQNPKIIKLKDDRTETYLKELRGIIDPSVQLVLTVFPQMKSDRYAAIKKLCCGGNRID